MALAWSPLSAAIKERKEEIVFLISPFIQSKALSQLQGISQFGHNLSIITRWNAEDILSGVSDLDIYPILKSQGIRLYINKHIHLKMLIYSNNITFIGSGNVTSHGLGFCANPNVEVGVFSSIDFDDWKRIFALIEDSILVDDEMYQKAVEYRNKYRLAPLPLPDFVLNESEKIVKQRRKAFSLNVLPASESPQVLYQNKETICQKSIDLNKLSPFLHDMLIYNLSSDTNEEEFMHDLKTSFLSTQFVSELIAYIKKSAPLNFGHISSWIHDHCSDVPLPYRYEIKKYVAILYTWLAFFVPEISWDIPGKRSQVIYWKQSHLS